MIIKPIYFVSGCCVMGIGSMLFVMPQLISDRWSIELETINNTDSNNICRNARVRDDTSERLSEFGFGTLPGEIKIKILTKNGAFFSYLYFTRETTDICISWKDHFCLQCIFTDLGTCFHNLKGHIIQLTQIKLALEICEVYFSDSVQYSFILCIPLLSFCSPYVALLQTSQKEYHSDPTTAFSMENRTTASRDPKAMWCLCCSSCLPSYSLVPVVLPFSLLEPPTLMTTWRERAHPCI